MWHKGFLKAELDKAKKNNAQNVQIPCFIEFQFPAYSRNFCTNKIWKLVGSVRKTFFSICWHYKTTVVVGFSVVMVVCFKVQFFLMSILFPVMKYLFSSKSQCKLVLLSKTISMYSACHPWLRVDSWKYRNSKLHRNGTVRGISPVSSQKSKVATQNFLSSIFLLIYSMALWIL